MNQQTLSLLASARHVPRHAVKPFTLLHFSDLHSDTDALARIMRDYEAGKDMVDDVICTGDMVSNSLRLIDSWWDRRVLTCIGNHDTASYIDRKYDWTALSPADRSAYYIEPFESGWNAVHAPGKPYYYKDYPDSTLRLIVTDAMLLSKNTRESAETKAQTEWLDALLDEAVFSGLHVLIASHAPHGGSVPVKSHFTAVNEKQMPVNSDCDLTDEITSLVAEKIKRGLNFAGYICGHTHQDAVWDVYGDGTQLMYCVTCANISNPAQWRDCDLARGKGLDAYNFVTVDTANRLVKLVRGGGADCDCFMRSRKALCVSYETGKIIGEL